MLEPKRPLKVFLCHAHADRDPVCGLYSRLTQDGVDAWLDKEKLLPGQDWELEIRKAVREADVVVVCLSRQFNQAGFRQKEVRLALDTAMEKPEGEIFIIPARLEECDNLESLRKWHWVDLFESNGYDMLMRALRARANNIGVILQIKRSWLPKITSPLPKKQKPFENKTTETSDEKLVNNVDDMSPSPELPDNWEAQRQAAFVKKAKEEKETVETTDKKVDRPSAKKTRKPNTTIVVSFIVLIMVSIFGLPSLFDTPMNDVPTATQTKGEVDLETQTLQPNLTPSIPTSTKTPLFTATPTPLPTEITDARGVTMRLVPAGDFVMGSEEGNEDEKPSQVLYIDNFFMDKYEVTNKFYSDCVVAGVCSPPKYISLNGPDNVGYDKKSYDIGNYFDAYFYEDYPVVYLNWYMARDYCVWRGARLPTEAEWEKASRGPLGDLYPWGNNYSCKQRNVFDFGLGTPLYGHGDEAPPYTGPLCDNYLTTAPVESFNVSPYGIVNLSGNVSEWVSSLYLSYPYNILDFENSDGIGERVYRGDSFFSNPMRSSQRESALPDYTATDLGFRCAYSP
jgi:formylglycine-generating enzyme required for sulfatase activity